nr:hypothetical protein BCU82_05965 [Vibrio cyclitrophicus]
MKLSQVLNHTNQFERSKFINCIDKLCQNNKGNTELVKQLDKIDGQLKVGGMYLTHGNTIVEEYEIVNKTVKPLHV